MIKLNKTTNIRKNEIILLKNKEDKKEYKNYIKL